MFSFSDLRIYVITTISAASALMVSASNANSQSGLDMARPDPNTALVEMVQRLESRLATLDQRVAALEQTTQGRNRSHESRVQAAPAAPRAATMSNCTPTRYVDLDGITRFRSSCDSAIAPGACDPPFSIDDTGIKRVKSDCLR